jgi:hypothetical protein
MAIQASSRAEDIALWVTKINQETEERWQTEGSCVPDLNRKAAYKLAVYHIERLLLCAVSPEQAAQEFANSVEPLILANQKEGGMTPIFDVIIHAIRTLGQDPDLSLRLHDFLEALSHLSVTDKEGNPKYAGYGWGKLWTDLPGWWMEFRASCFGKLDYWICVYQSCAVH